MDITVEVDAREVLALLERLGPTCEVNVHAVSRVTAHNVQNEARARARRRTGRLQHAITVEEMGPPMHGFKVFVDEMVDERGPRPEEFALWHELGTKYMSAQAFMGPAVALEQGAHLRRMADALQAAIDEETD